VSTSENRDILVQLIRDALVGKGVDLGWTRVPKLLAAITDLKGDPHGRVVVFEEAVRGCIAADPALKIRLRDILNEKP